MLSEEGADLVDHKKQLRLNIVYDTADELPTSLAIGEHETFEDVKKLALEIILKKMTPYAYEVRSSEENFSIVASGCFVMDHDGQVTLLVRRRQPKGIADVSSVAELLQFCNLPHEDGTKLMWVNGLHSTLHQIVDDAAVSGSMCSLTCRLEQCMKKSVFPFAQFFASCA